MTRDGRYQPRSGCGTRCRGIARVLRHAQCRVARWPSSEIVAMPTTHEWREGPVGPAHRPADGDDASDPAVCQGLSSAEAAARLRRDGTNTLPEPPSPSAWRV